MLEELGYSLDEINHIMKGFTDDFSEDLLKMKKQFENVSIVANNFASILDDISSMMKDDTGAKAMVANLGLVLKAISKVTQEIGDMAEEWKKGELGALQAMTSISGIISALVTVVSSWASAEAPAVSPLQQEFLSPEQAGRLSPDYGQARVVYNNNSLATSFQFLDVSQLTPHTQRSIAEGFADELAEILKSRGDI